MDEDQKDMRRIHQDIFQSLRNTEGNRIEMELSRDDWLLILSALEIAVGA
jgi:hypothetical protein